MAPGLEPRQPNIQMFVSLTPEGQISIGAQCLGVDISTLHRISVQQSRKLRADLEQAEKQAESLIAQASNK